MADQYLYKNEFVRDGDTVADYLATAACISWDNETGKISKIQTNQPWEYIVANIDNTNEYYIKTDTVQIKTFNNKKFVSVLLADKNLKENSADYSELTININDCNMGFGRAYFIDFNGKEKFHNDFVIKGNSVISGIAEIACSKV